MVSGIFPETIFSPKEKAMKTLSLLLIASLAFCLFGCKTTETSELQPPPEEEFVEVQPAAPETPAAPAAPGLQKNADGTFTMQMSEVK